jgi:DNA repair exonuclease SbcCD ATPase subunit
MLKFKKISFKNFLAVGDKGVDIEFIPGTLTLIMGHNGSGKSTIVDALIYVLWGKPHRPKLNIGDMVNDQNKKGMLVTLDLSNGQDHYRIIRGERPKKLEIHKLYNDSYKMMDKFSSTDLQNKYIINNILGQDRDLFMQLSVIGKSNYIPPLELSIPKRRELVEQIFNLSIFSGMKDTIKGYGTDVYQKKLKLDSLIDNKHVEIEYAKKLIAQAEQDLNLRYKEIEEFRDEHLDYIKTFESEIKDLNFSQKNYTDKLNNLRANQKSKSDLDRSLWRLESNLESKIKEKITLETKSNTCSSCGQTLPVDDIKDLIDNLSKDIDDIRHKIISAREKTSDQEIILNRIEEEVDRLKNDSINRRNLLDKINKSNDEISKLDKRLNDMKKPVKHNVSLDDLLVDLEDLIVEREVSLERLKYIKYFKDDFLSDKGFKAYILARYFPELNKSANRLLQDYNMDYTIEVQQDFSFGIFDNMGKEIPYSRFSEGQKQRLNLSVWESLIGIIKTRRNVASNTVIFDEILDSSMDVEGKAVFIESLRHKIERDNTCGFIISHSMDNFDRVIKVDMKNGFSNYEFINELNLDIEKINKEYE